MTTDWNHLPNAIHIERVLDTLAVNNSEFFAAWNQKWQRAPVRIAASSDAWDTTWINGRHPVYEGLVQASLDATMLMRWDHQSDAIMNVRDTISALITYDHAGQFMDMPYSELRTWAALSEDPAAILMLSWAKTRELIAGKQLTVYPKSAILQKQ